MSQETKTEKYYPDFIRGEIDLSKYNYARWGNPTDNEIKKQLVKKFLDPGSRVSTQRFYHFDKKVITPESPDDLLFGYFKKSMCQLIKPEDEIIKRKDWAEYQALLGESLEILNHPIFEKMASYIRSNNNKRSDNLLVFSCGHWKPYSQSKNFYSTQLFYKLTPENLKCFDTVVLSETGVIPISPGNDFSFCYPFRHYDWNPKSESKEIKREAEDKMYFYLSSFIKEQGYKRVSISSRSQTYLNILKRLKEDFPEVEVNWIQTEENINVFLRAYNHDDYIGEKYHVFKTRFCQSPLHVAFVLKSFGLELPGNFLLFLEKKGMFDKKGIREIFTNN
jgi:hypothetical protein